MKRWMPLVVCSMLAAPSYAAPKLSTATGNYFYIYKDKSASANHFAPSGWMGDYGDLKIDDASRDNPEDGLTAIKWTYSGKATQGANWAGVYWQNPPNNWGDKPGAYDLTGFKRLTYWARGEKGGELLTEVKVGGISGEHGDSDAVSAGAVTLTKDWKKYTIDLAGANLAKIAGGFCWATNIDSNPNGMTFYLDEIRFER